MTEITNHYNLEPNDDVIENINSYECFYDNLKLCKLTYVCKKLLFNKWDKIVLISLFVFFEFCLTILKYVDIYLFSLLINLSEFSINNKITICYLTLRGVSQLLSENNKSLIKYISTKYISEHETLIQEKINKLDFLTVNKFEKWKIVQYSILYIPNFIKSFSNFSNLGFLFFEFFMINVYLLTNNYFLESLIVVTGFSFLLFLNVYKFFKLIPFLDIFNEHFNGLYNLKDEQFSNTEYLKSADIVLKDNCHNRFTSKYKEILKESQNIYLLNSKFSLGLVSFSTCVYASVFILATFKPEFNIYLLIYTLYLLLDPINSYIFTFIDNLTNVSYIGGLYDFFHLKNLDEFVETTNEKPSKVDIETSITKLTHEIEKVESIEFKNVCKKIKDKTILHNVSFRIKPGMKVGIVGDSGSGKSTIDKLILKMMTPTSGDVYFNEINANQLTFETIRDHVIYIGQEPKLFDLSLKENLQMEMNYPTESVTDEQLLEMMNRINLNVSLERLHENVGMFGNNFSGGQKQKINILRGLLKQASVIILDEPTSALDVNSEHQVMEYIHEICNDKIMIIIAHKLYTIKNVDYILVMREGKIVEEGTHEELMIKNEIYKEMFDKFYEH
jgi:ABC-type bacteriocin/lantibiotic exporter with double-glycine peptidase domain